jgi:DNA polymerase (family 10)
MSKTVHNQQIADLFHRLADLLEIDGANPFRVRAYRQAAQTIAGLSETLADRLDRGEDPTKLPNIGKGIAQKITRILETGELPQLEELEERLPSQLSELMQLSGLGPKRVKTLHQDLGIDSLADLKGAVEQHRVRQLSGFGAKTERKLGERLQRWEGRERRTRLFEAEQIARPLLDYLRAIEGVKDLQIAGSLRRRRATVGDLDILVSARRDSPVMQRFVDYDEAREIVSQGSTRSTLILQSGMQVDLRLVPQVAYGAALHYFTGSKAHNIRVRRMGVEQGLKINEYGVFRDDERVAGESEESVYASVGLPYIEPELREDRGEIEAAREQRLPRLVRLQDIRGDLHLHTDATDGHDDLRRMAEAAIQRGYEYIAVTDHSRRVSVAHGLDEPRLARQIDAIDRLNEELAGRITLLKGIELDILEDGSLDLPDAILAHLDLRVCSVHYHFELSRKRQTERILRAMDSPYCNILAHPSGRLLGERDPYEVDLERLMQAAVQRGCFLEVNAQPQRMDLDDAGCRLAGQLGLKVAVSTDAHNTTNLEYMRLGVDQARRGWLSADDVINTRSLDGLRRLLRRD